LAAALEGLPALLVDGPPKKSNPRRESCGFVAAFGAGAADGGPVRVGFDAGMSAVLGLTGGVGAKSSNRFTFCAGRGAGAGCAAACRWEVDLSILAFS
jgi:hypothetical protein